MNALPTLPKNLFTFCLIVSAGLLLLSFHGIAADRSEIQDRILDALRNARKITAFYRLEHVIDKGLGDPVSFDLSDPEFRRRLIAEFDATKLTVNYKSTQEYRDKTGAGLIIENSPHCWIVIDNSDGFPISFEVTPKFLIINRALVVEMADYYPLVRKIIGLHQSKKESSLAILRAAFEKGPKTQDDATRISDAARTLDLADSVAMMGEIQRRINARTTITGPEEIVLGHVFTRVADLSEDKAKEYLTTLPPRNFGFIGLEDAMGIRGKLGGMPGLFRAYRESQSTFARNQLLEVIEAAFSGLPQEDANGDRYVSYVERWYELNKAKLRFDPEHPGTNSLSTVPTPEHCRKIGIFIVPEDLLEQPADKSEVPL